MYNMCCIEKWVFIALKTPDTTIVPCQDCKKDEDMYTQKSKGWVKHLDFIILDMVCLQVAFVLAYITRHGFQSPYASGFYRSMAIIYMLFDFAVLIGCSTMKNVLKRDYIKEIKQTFKHVCMLTLFVALYLFAIQAGDEYSRITFFVMTVYYAVISYGVRLHWKDRLLRRRNINFSKAIYFIVNRNNAENVIRCFLDNHLENYVIQGVCVLDGGYEQVLGMPVTATADTVLRYLCDNWVDEVYISLPEKDIQTEKLVSSITEMGIVVHVEMSQIETEEWMHQTIQKVGGSTVRTVSMTMATSQQLMLKRAVDILGGIVGCILTGLLTLVIGPIIFIHSPGPIFFVQTRVGRNGKKFKMYKFRSMYLDAEERKAELMKENRIGDGLMFKLDYDPRIIGCKRRTDGTVKKGFGNFIRDWSLDEFPQFFNVLKGDLSLCGTRPPTVDEWEKYELHHRARLAIRPGITGLWQVSGRSNITDFEQVVELDKKYIREWSMGLDFRILLETVRVVLTREGSM